MSCEAVEQHNDNFIEECNVQLQYKIPAIPNLKNNTITATTNKIRNSNDLDENNIDKFQDYYNNKNEQQITKISLMLEYDIDNTLNSLKENNTCINYLKSPLSSAVSLKSINNPSSFQYENVCIKNTEINNNRNNTNNNSNNNNNNVRNNTTTYDDKIPKSISINSNLCNNTVTSVTNAKKRWNILAKVLRKGSLDEEEQSVSSDDGVGDTASVRRFKSFDLLHQNSFEDYSSLNLIGKPENWYTYKIYLNDKEFLANIHHINRHLTAIDLMGFNNTGNICIWPSEEALAVYALSDLNQYDNKWILELGGGMTCLTGIFLAKYAKPYIVHLTDGNNISVENVRKTICLNDLSCYTKCSVLKWENVMGRLETEYEKFDYILSADCLFFDDVRTALVETIWFYLSPDGIALVIAPERGNTMTQFIHECSIKGFQYEKIYRYNEIIWQKHLDLQKSELYNEDIHYPVLIKLTKPNLKADYWKSNERKYCDYCKCWITDNKASVSFHENGKRHQIAVQQRISEISRKSAKEEKEKNKFDHEMRKMEDAAMKAYAGDVSARADISGRIINSLRPSTNSSVSVTTAHKRATGQVDPLRLGVDSDSDDDNNMPKVQKKSNDIEASAQESLWVEGISDDGLTYYWNVKTYESVWVAPKEGYMSLEEYEKLDEIAKKQQEMQYALEAKNFRENVDEEVAKYNREKLKIYRKVETEKEKKDKEETRKSYATEEEAATSSIGSWQVVQEKKPEIIDLGLPKVEQKWMPDVVTQPELFLEPREKRFKEKTIKGLDRDATAGISISFIKKKPPRSVRQRLNDD